MLNRPPADNAVTEYGHVEKPRILVVVDTEEEFPWDKPHSRSNTSVTAMAEIGRGQAIFDRYGIKPTYVIDYPVATQEAGYRPLEPIVDSGHCIIGAHLHPWVTPPMDEELRSENTFPGNLALDIEHAKLAALTKAIEQRFERPTIYKAGRYGVGPNTSRILSSLDYDIDLSPTPGYSYRSSGGPDFTDHPCSPYWFDDGTRLCIPCTGGFVGRMAKSGKQIYPVLTKPLSKKMRLGGIASRLRLLERVRLSPEGFSLDDMVRLTDYLYFERGVRTFTLSYHSPSLKAGCTPYVRSERELGAFLDVISAYLDYFFGKLDGMAASPSEIKRDLERMQIA